MPLSHKGVCAYLGRRVMPGTALAVCGLPERHVRSPWEVALLAARLGSAQPQHTQSYTSAMAMLQLKILISHLYVHKYRRVHSSTLY